MIERMRLEYDPQADALYISFQEKYVAKSREISPGVVIDEDENGSTIGIEMLEVSKKIPHHELVSFQVKSLAHV